MALDVVTRSGESTWARAPLGVSLTHPRLGRRHARAPALTGLGIADTATDRLAPQASWFTCKRGECLLRGEASGAVDIGVGWHHAGASGGKPQADFTAT